MVKLDAGENSEALLMEVMEIYHFVEVPYWEYDASDAVSVERC